MILHYLKISWRNIWNDKFYSIVNLIGLSIAFTVVFLFMQWIRYEFYFEKCYPNYDRIYQVQEAEKRNDGIYKSMKLNHSLKGFENDFYFVDEIVSFECYEEGININQESFMFNNAQASTNFLKVFPMECIAGNSEHIDKNKSQVFISEDAAIRFFGSVQNALHKELDYFLEKKTITAVLRVPKQTIFQFDVLNLNEKGHNFYIKLKENISLTEEQQQIMGQFLTQRYGSKNKLVFEPITMLHLYSDEKTNKINYKNIYFGSIKEIRILVIIVSLIAILAIINYVNTSTARSMSRFKEVGVRKMIGASKKQLVLRFLTESFIITSISVFLAIDLAKIMHNLFENIIGNTFPFQFDSVTVAFSFTFIIFSSVFAGGYAAFYLSSLNPISVLSSGVGKINSKSNVRKILLGIQFAISIGIIICTWTIYRQLHYMLHKDLGFNKEDIYMLDTSLMYNSEDFIKELKKSTSIKEATMAAHPPFNVEWGFSGVHWNNKPQEAQEIEFTQIFCDHNFANTFGLELIQGEFIPSGLNWWKKGENEATNIVINETFKKLIGEENPIGITVSYGKNISLEGKIIGVVKDFYFRPMNFKISPLIISFDPESTIKMFIKIHREKEKEALEHIKKTYHKMRSNSVLLSERPFLLTSLEEEYNKLYKSEIRLQNMLIIFSIISLILSLLGIISIVAFIIEKRTKEIGIRKINGATWKDIIWEFWKEFLILIGISMIPSVMISYIFLNNWINNYAYRVSLAWWVFLLVPLLIAFLTIIILFFQVQKIALRNPIECLKSE